MECEWFRDALSARLDGEVPDVPDSALDRHLARCAPCRSWIAAAQELSRRTRVLPIEPVPDLAGSILAAAHEPLGADGARLRLRLALGALAVVQIVLGLPGLLFGEDGAAPVHVAHELGSWEVALAIGFLFAALRPARAWGMLPLVVALVGCLILTTAVDLVDGHAGLIRESLHALEVLALGLLWALARKPGARPLAKLRPA